MTRYYTFGLALLLVLFCGFIRPAKGLTQTEIDALIDFYDATDGENWIRNTNWKNNNDPCAPGLVWYGLTCTAEGNLVGIYLDSNEVSGTLVSAIADLQDLEVLDLFANKIAGTLPPELSDMDNLQELYLGLNQFSGSLPSEWSGMNSLVWLDLWNNTLSGTIPESWYSWDIGTITLNLNEIEGFLPAVRPDWDQFFLRDNQFYCELPAWCVVDGENLCEPCYSVTGTPTPTVTPTSTSVPTPPETATPTPTPTPTETPTPSSVPTPPETLTPTQTVTPTSTSVPTPPETVTPTGTATPSATPSPSETSTPPDQICIIIIFIKICFDI